MKERPILFNGPMVRAILDGRKTQTRRILKAQPFAVETSAFGPPHVCWSENEMPCFEPLDCPYGQPGDRLWVRETWCCKMDDGNFVYDAKGEHECYYAATEKDHITKDDGNGGVAFREDGTEASPWVSPLFMPRWASRITLEVTAVRVERLNDISPDDCRAEGMPKDNNDIGVRYAYGQFWNQINGPGSWHLNPWVWVITFKRV